MLLTSYGRKYSLSCKSEKCKIDKWLHEMFMNTLMKMLLEEFQNAEEFENA